MPIDRITKAEIIGHLDKVMAMNALLREKIQSSQDSLVEDSRFEIEKAVRLLLTALSLEEETLHGRRSNKSSVKL